MTTSCCHAESRVLDCRMTVNGFRRRRTCLTCSSRFSTIEKVVEYSCTMMDFGKPAWQMRDADVSYKALKKPISLKKSTSTLISRLKAKGIL